MHQMNFHENWFYWCYLLSFSRPALLCLCKDGGESGAKLDRWFSSEEFQEKKVTWANQKLQQFFIKFRVAGKLNCCDDTSV